LVTNNPFLGPQWEELAIALESSLARAYVGHTFDIQTYAERFGLSPDTSPYIQAKVFDDILQVEISANLMVRPQLSLEQYKTLQFYGWELPEVNPDEYQKNASGNPNMVRYFDLETAPKQIVEAILTALVGVYGIVESDFWGFSDSAEADRVGEMKILGRLKKTSTNPFGVVFALPGYHEDMLEQTSEDHF